MLHCVRSGGDANRGVWGDSTHFGGRGWRSGVAEDTATREADLREMLDVWRGAMRFDVLLEGYRLIGDYFANADNFGLGVQ